MSAIPREERIKFVGASEVPAVVNQNPFKTRYQVWLEKAGLVEPDDLSDKPAVLIGQALETFIAERWAEKEGVQVQPYNEHRVHRDCPRYASSFDFVTADGELVECKAPGYRAWRAWGEQPSLPHELQLQAEMDCDQRERGWLVILPLGEGKDPIGFPYDARPDVQGRLLSEVENFWQSIDRRDPPPADYGRDAKAVIASRNALLAGATLSATPLVTDDPHIAAKIGRHKELGAEGRALDGERKALQAEIMAAMGEHKVLLAGAHKVSLSVIGEKLIPEHTRAGYLRMSVGKGQQRRVGCSRFPGDERWEITYGLW